jgi:transcriptional regulator with XRE-family HTH domain
MFKRIKDLRIDNDKTQYDLASYLGMTQMGYSKYETGGAVPPADKLIKLALLYDTSVDYILNLTDEIRPYKRKRK